MLRAPRPGDGAGLWAFGREGDPDFQRLRLRGPPGRQALPRRERHQDDPENLRLRELLPRLQADRNRPRRRGPGGHPRCGNRRRHRPVGPYPYQMDVRNLTPGARPGRAQAEVVSACRTQTSGGAASPAVAESADRSAKPSDPQQDLHCRRSRPAAGPRRHRTQLGLAPDGGPKALGARAMLSTRKRRRSRPMRPPARPESRLPPEEPRLRPRRGGGARVGLAGAGRRAAGGAAAGCAGAGAAGVRVT